MPGKNKSRGYCLEMICADFLASAHLDNRNPEILLHSISRYRKFLPGKQRQAFLENMREKTPRPTALGKTPRLWPDQELCEQAVSRRRRLSRTCYFLAWQIKKLQDVRPFRRRQK